MNADDPRTWHPELTGPPDPALAARFFAMTRGDEVVDVPPPGSRLARFLELCAAHDAGWLTKAQLDSRVRALVREVISEVEADDAP